MARGGEGRKSPDDPQEKALWDAFQKFDANGNGRIEAEEFFKLMKSLGSFSAKEIARLFSEADTDGSGGVDWREFLKWICSGKATKDMSSSAAKSFTRLLQSEAHDEASFVEEAAVSHAVTTYLKAAHQERTEAEEHNAKSRQRNKMKKVAQQKEGSKSSTTGVDDMEVGENYKGLRLATPITYESAEALMKHYLVNGESNPLHPKYVAHITTEFTNAYRLKHPKPVVHTDTPPAGRLTIVGDTHGQLADVLHILNQLGPPSATNRYLINGDIADRGRQAVEIFMIFFAFFLADPECLIIHRGNHENEDMNALDLDSGGGFGDEVLTKYGPMAYRRFVSAFKVLSLCSVVQKEIFVVHGGLTRVKSLSIDYINSIEHFECTAPHPMATNVKDQLFSDLLWSDPTPAQGKFKSERGIGIKFGPDMTMKFCMQNRLRFIVRSHQVPEDGRGYCKQHDGRCVTVFSASNYCGNGGNYGAVLVLASAHFPKYEIYEHYAVSLEELAKSLGHDGSAENAILKASLADSKPDQEACSAARWVKEMERMTIAIIEKKPQIWAHIVDMSMARHQTLEDFEELMCEFVEGGHPWAQAAKMWGIIDEDGTVDIGRVLARWLVSIESEKYSSFLVRAVKIVYESILSLDMDLENSFRLFDVDGDGCVDLKEVRQVLGMFDLGLTHSQLDRLTGQIFNHATANSSSKQKINVQEFLGHFTMIYKQTSMNGEKLESWMMQALEQIARLIIKTPADTLLTDLEHSAALMIQKVARGAAVRREVRAEAAKKGDGPAYSSEAEGAAPRAGSKPRAPARKSVQSAVVLQPTGTAKSEPSGVRRDSLSGIPKMVALFQALDYSKDGLLQVEEFVSGLEKIPGVKKLVVEGEPLTHARLVTLVGAIDTSKNGTINYLEFLNAFQISDEATLDVGETLMEDITTVLFRHRLAIRKGCVYFDEEGVGSIFAEDFSKVLQAVNNTLARPERTLTTQQVNLLVEALSSSEATGGEEAVVDYEAFLKSFVILDKEKDRAVNQEVLLSRSARRTCVSSPVHLARLCACCVRMSGLGCR
eukprot:CAMPEP_0171071238 /NCGR_PEP_ID=MMETSP0766_2-20121228/10208_1 /TAXON_ID=439317 /ORGANISM="Gambierdiscus australes, Strain CAWD 149" /LENGTH=1052 /DNA_ID=CAMNT_0011527771 /DNA_START=39 /DNA_END=3192 /DNA_ORIENTATION=-